jgi:hypothetical protein
MVIVNSGDWRGMGEGTAARLHANSAMTKDRSADLFLARV